MFNLLEDVFTKALDDIEWYSHEKDGKLFLVIDVSGINPKDVEISVKQPNKFSYYTLTVKGETFNELIDKTFKVNAEWIVREKIREIVKHFENGLLYLEIEFDTPAQPEVIIRER